MLLACKEHRPRKAVTSAANTWKDTTATQEGDIICV